MNEIIYLSLNQVKPYENNPRINDDAVEMVAKSIEEFGFKNPIIVDSNMIIIAGHTRLKAAERLGIEEIPVIIADDLTDDQANALRLVDNKTSELAQWDFEKLKLELDNINMDMLDFDFNYDELNIEDLKPIEEDNFDLEEALEEINEPITKTGDLWRLGRHYLLCGDSTKQNDVKALMQGYTADLLVTDPPYNVAITNSEGLTIENDNMNKEDFKIFINSALKNASDILKKGGAFYIWYGDCEDIAFRTACFNNGLTIRQCLIWVKNNFNLGRQDYQWKHEPCLYGWKEGASHYFIDDRTQDTIIEDKIDYQSMTKEQLKDYIKELLQDRTSTTIIKEDKPLKNDEHPTMKPIKLMARLIKNSSKRNEIIVDLFGGSGSTLISCQELDRICYMMEYDPKYCDVIIKRWETLTGEKAEFVK